MAISAETTSIESALDEARKAWRTHVQPKVEMKGDRFYAHVYTLVRRHVYAHVYALGVGMSMHMSIHPTCV